MSSSVKLRLLLLHLFLYSVSCSSDGILSTVVRRHGVPDTIFPSTCPPACDALFHAVEGVSNSTADHCTCTCPLEAPVYLNTAGYCVDKLDECRHQIAFSSSLNSGRYIPVVTLPVHNGVVLPKRNIMWRESHISVSSTGGVNCSITGAFYDNSLHRWRTTSKRGLFELVTAGGRTQIVYRGVESDASLLAGSVVQLKISCARFLPDDHCIAFRVAGISGISPSNLSSHPGRSHWALTVLAVTVVLVLAGTAFVIWQLCWRRKKKRLITDLQMQFLYHMKQQQEAHKQAAAHMAAQMGSPAEFSPNSTRTVGPPIKRRLFFSADYLDHDMMVSPPPMAEQFLFEIRRTIEMARERIRMRRFVPMLITIPEVAEEPRPLSVVEVDETVSSTESLSQESPRSENKSIDSGRESRDDSDESPEEEELGGNGGSVRRIVSGFESRGSRPSQLPVAAQKIIFPPRSTPKTQIPPRSSRPAVSQIPILLGQASPRPSHRGISLATPALPRTPPPAESKDPNKSYRARKGYSVFPADPMLHKSLPRRPKRTGIPRAIEES